MSLRHRQRKRCLYLNFEELKQVQLSNFTRSNRRLYLNYKELKLQTSVRWNYENIGNVVAINNKTLIVHGAVFSTIDVFIWIYKMMIYLRTIIWIALISGMWSFNLFVLDYWCYSFCSSCGFSVQIKNASDNSIELKRKSKRWMYKLRKVITDGNSDRFTKYCFWTWKRCTRN